MVGLPGFEPGSRTPEAQSLDQASRQPLSRSLSVLSNDFALVLKTLAKLQHMYRTNQKVMDTKLKRLSRETRLVDPVTAGQHSSLGVSNNYRSKF
jgi:hypothetical protein